MRQGDRVASTYAIDFCLLAFDICWDEEPLMHQFHHELCSNVKDLLLTFNEDPKSPMEAISRVVQCHNQLFE